VDRYPSIKAVQAQLAEAYLAKGDFDLAIADWKELVQKTPDSNLAAGSVNRSCQGKE
jgi:hypothetical protein